MQSERIDICPMCGKEMTVVGRTTMHYECLDCNKEREKFIKDVTELFVTDNTRQNLFEDIADYILQEKSQSFAEGKKQGRSEVENTAKCGCCGAPMVSIRGKYPKLESRIICPVCAYETLEQIHEISNPSSRIPCSSKCSNQSLAEGK